MPITSWILLAASVTGQATVEAPHAGNLVYAQVRDQGIETGGTRVALPSPRLFDGQDAAAQRAALKELAGSDQALEDLLRPSITAPFIIKVNDVKSAKGAIRAADLWFVIYADPKQLDPAEQAARADQKETEVGNMSFQTRLLKPDDLRAAGIAPDAAVPSAKIWYAHVRSRLLGRIEFEVTNKVMATRSDQSIVIASRTDPAFAREGPRQNAWKATSATAPTQPDAAPHPYEGGISYAKMSNIAFQPGAVLVEMHMAFVEPHEWFQGAPILRSKFSIAAQDQIRTLRRELAKTRAK